MAADAAVDPMALRAALGQFATGVCLVTLRGEEGVALALTVNSFASVSLDPPLILWSIQRDSDIYEPYVSASRFAINVLARDQEPLSALYAQSGDHVMADEHWELGEHDLPVVRGALACFECVVKQTIAGGDHTIILAAVTRFAAQSGGRAPLLFFAGNYRSLDA